MRNLIIFFLARTNMLVPNYQPEILKRTEVITKAINSCQTFEQLDKIKQSYIPVYLSEAFPYKEVEASVLILNSHIGWKELELKQSVNK